MTKLFNLANQNDNVHSAHINKSLAVHKYIESDWIPSF